MGIAFVGPGPTRRRQAGRPGDGADRLMQNKTQQAAQAIPDGAQSIGGFKHWSRRLGSCSCTETLIWELGRTGQR